jgi:hypothetical protein
MLWLRPRSHWCSATSVQSQPNIGVPKCSLSKYGFRASGVRTGASTDRAETSLLPGFSNFVLKRPSQKVRREWASGKRIPAVSAPGQSTGLSRKPQETCHSARRSVRRRARLAWELAEQAVRREPVSASRKGQFPCSAGKYREIATPWVRQRAQFLVAIGHF